MKRWLRATLPPDSYIGTLVVVYCLLEFLPRAFGLGTDATIPCSTTTDESDLACSTPARLHVISSAQNCVRLQSAG